MVVMVNSSSLMLVFVWSIIFTLPKLGRSCEFNCMIAEYCGSPPEFTNVSVTYKSFTYAPKLFGTKTQFFNTYDLSGRNISSIAPNGLSCLFNLHPGNDGSSYNFEDVTRTDLVLLDNNSFTVLPSMLEFNNTGFVSFQNNQISKLGENAFADFIGNSLTIELQHNMIESIEPGSFNGVGGGTLQVNLDHNQVSRLTARTFAGGPSNFVVTYVFLAYNNVTVLEPGAFLGNLTSYNGFTLIVDLEHNNLATVAQGTFKGYLGGNLDVNLQNNLITMVEHDVFAGFGGSAVGTDRLSVYLQHNLITFLEAGMFAFTGYGLTVHLSFNSITSLPDATFALFTGLEMNVILENCGIISLGPVFNLFIGGGGTATLELSHNHITGGDIQVVLGSFPGNTEKLILTLANNSISFLPPSMFKGIGSTGTSSVYSKFQLDVSLNPITNISSDSFKGYDEALESVLVNISFPTAGKVATPPTFNLDGNWGSTGTSFYLILRGSGVDLSVANAFPAQPPSQNSFWHFLPDTLKLDLSHNNYTHVPSNVFNTSGVFMLDLSYNAITMVADDAFGYTFHLQQLNLSNNLLTSVPILSRTPALSVFSLEKNKIVALPIESNHVALQTSMSNNIIQCEAYGPALRNCSCTQANYMYSEHCGYGRCLFNSTTGCPSDTLLIFSGCALAPYSQCIKTCPSGQYYDTTAQACLPVAVCSLLFDDEGSPSGYRDAYQVSDFGLSSNRQCSICSTCPEGYKTVACTTTSNSRCTRSAHLAQGDIASIILSILIAVVMAGVGWWYGRTQLIKQNKTRGELELTEMLLGDVTEEKDRITEEKRLMQQAWTIDESDLRMKQVIGNGAFGTVYSAMWGHIPVAVKVLKIPLDDLDPLMTEDFDREVTFMQSIRHPNLLTFYGAGVNTNSQAYLVTELMEGGSLWQLLKQLQRRVMWVDRLSFARDIAKGMRYLHEKGTLHRDLKADNCFLDSHLRVKVADFGTGKIQSKFKRVRESISGSSNMDMDRSGKTLTGGTGSLLWMAPEVLRGDKISDQQANAIDVFSFGMVMYEIWARARPWNEVRGDGIEFVTKLVDLTMNGVRPQLPSVINTADAAPDGYAPLMHVCCSTQPQDRPTFASILELLAHMDVAEYLDVES
eukprot:m.236477 g.236477  ORF g.236477 m.236477 type:complete len:1135 (+) comp33686_c0_seq10:282-3686(+)